MQISEQKLRVIVREELQTQLQLNEIDIKTFGNKIADVFKTIKNKIMPEKPTGPEYGMIDSIIKDLTAILPLEGRNDVIKTVESILNTLALQKDGKYIYGDKKYSKDANLIITELIKFVDEARKAQQELIKIAKKQQTSDIGIEGYGADEDEEEQPQNENKSNSYNMIFENWRNYQKLINEVAPQTNEERLEKLKKLISSYQEIYLNTEEDERQNKLTPKELYNILIDKDKDPNKSFDYIKRNAIELPADRRARTYSSIKNFLNKRVEVPQDMLKTSSQPKEPKEVTNQEQEQKDKGTTNEQPTAQQNPLQPLNTKINKIYNVVSQQVTTRLNVDKSNTKEYQLLNINYLLKIVFERIISPFFFKLEMNDKVEEAIKNLLKNIQKFILHIGENKPTTTTTTPTSTEAPASSEPAAPETTATAPAT